MRLLVQGGQDAESVELLLSLTSISSEDVKDALTDHLVRGLADSTSCALHDVKQSNFNRALKRLEETAAIVEQLIEKRVRHLKSVNLDKLVTK